MLGNHMVRPAHFRGPFRYPTQCDPTKQRFAIISIRFIPTSIPIIPDQLRADEFLNEFGAFVRAREEGKGPNLPSFVLLYLPDDHTGGTRPGKPTQTLPLPTTISLLGRVVEAVSHSPYWDDTAILVVEDDAQDGADHVDAHRSTALVISKYSPGSRSSPYVDSRFYTTVSMIHTMEQLLGLPPMNQNDAWAPLIAPLFTGAGQAAPLPSRYEQQGQWADLHGKRKDSPGSKESRRNGLFPSRRRKSVCPERHSLASVKRKCATANIPPRLQRRPLKVPTTKRFLNTGRAPELDFEMLRPVFDHVVRSFKVR